MKFQKQVEELEKKFKKELNEEDFLFCPAVNTTEKKINFNMKPFMRMLPDVVKKVPHDIDGTIFYVVDVPHEECFHTKYKDGRHFETHFSSQKGINGVRGLGKCKGSFECNNNGCPMFQVRGKRNQNHFTTQEKNSFCYYCNCIVYRVPCGASKMIEFNTQGRLLEVYHQGRHTCQLKPNAEEKAILIEEV